MFKISLEDVKKKIIEKSGMSAEELDAKIKSKIDKFSGMVSEEGAAHIIANEMKVELFSQDEKQGSFKINKLMPGMRNVEIVAKVIRNYGLREFNTSNGEGKVTSLVVNDGTGFTRLVGWHAMAEQIEKAKENDIIKADGIFIKENKRGNKEAHLTDSSNILMNPEGVKIDVQANSLYTSKKVSTINEKDEMVRVIGTLINVFDVRFFPKCPECNKKAVARDDAFFCNEHGEVQPAYSYVLNALLDDGSGIIRTIFWKNQLEALTGKNEDEIRSFREKPDEFENIKMDLLGSIIKLEARVTKNDMFDRIELHAQRVYPKLDPQEELKFLEELKKNNNS